MDDNTDYLIHYGVMGMKWGVRKRRESSDRSGSRRSISKKKNTKTSVSKSFESTKSKIKNRISKIDKKKVKEIAKSSAVVAGKIAAVAALGTVGGYAVSQLVDQYYQPSSKVETIGNRPPILSTTRKLRPRSYVTNRTVPLWPNTDLIKGHFPDKVTEADLNKFFKQYEFLRKNNPALDALDLKNPLDKLKDL